MNEEMTVKRLQEILSSLNPGYFIGVNLVGNLAIGAYNTNGEIQTIGYLDLNEEKVIMFEELEEKELAIA